MTEIDAVGTEHSPLNPLRNLNSTSAVREHSSLGSLLWQYSYLQMLDFLTTIAFLVNGVREGNPLVRLVLNLGNSPIASLLAVKALAMLLGIYCWRVGKRQLLSRINLLFALLVAWNLVALILIRVRP
jgi:hypothetical protein